MSEISRPIPSTFWYAQLRVRCHSRVQRRHVGRWCSMVYQRSTVSSGTEDSPLPLLQQRHGLVQRAARTADNRRASRCRSLRHALHLSRSASHVQQVVIEKRLFRLPPEILLRPCDTRLLVELVASFLMITHDLSPFLVECLLLDSNLTCPPWLDSFLPMAFYLLLLHKQQRYGSRVFAREQLSHRTLLYSLFCGTLIICFPRFFPHTLYTRQHLPDYPCRA